MYYINKILTGTDGRLVHAHFLNGHIVVHCDRQFAVLVALKPYKKAQIIKAGSIRVKIAFKQFKYVNCHLVHSKIWLNRKLLRAGSIRVTIAFKQFKYVNCLVVHLKIWLNVMVEI